MGWIAAVAAAGGAILGGVIQSNGAQNAADTQAQAAQNAAQVQYKEFEQEQAALAPYRAGGFQAYNKMLQLEGLNPVYQGSGNPFAASQSHGAPQHSMGSFSGTGMGQPSAGGPMPQPSQGSSAIKVPVPITGIKAYADGGNFAAGQKMLVGEGGHPEAIFNQHGNLSGVVTQPTYGTATQSGTVVPLSGHVGGYLGSHLSPLGLASSGGGSVYPTSSGGTQSGGPIGMAQVGGQPVNLGGMNPGPANTTGLLGSPTPISGPVSQPPPGYTPGPISGGGSSGSTSPTPAGRPTYIGGIRVGGGTSSGGTNPDGSQTVSANGTTWQTDPGYQFRLQQGQDVIQNNALAHGMGLSGAALKELTRYNQQFASNEYANAYNRLAQIAGFGTSATSQQNALGQAMAGNIGQYLTNAGNAGALGQIGSANAWSNTLNNLAGIYGTYASGGYGG